MNQKEYKMIFQIGANLASTFNTSFGSACKRLQELAQETSETSKTLKDVSGFQKAKASVEENEQKLERLRDEYRSLQTTIASARHDVERFPAAIEEQEKAIKETVKAISKHQQALQNYDEGTDAYKEINAEIKKERQELREQQKEYKKLAASQANAKKSYQDITDNMAEHDKQIEKTHDAIEKQKETVYKYSRKLAEAGINVNNLTEEQKNLQKQYEDFKTAREHLQKVGAEYDELTQKAREQATEVGKLMGIYAAAGAAFYKGAIEPAIEFESAYTGVLKTVDGTPEQLQRIKEDILDLSTNVPTATADIAAVAEAAGQLGIAVEDITNFSSVMIDLGESTNLSSDEAASSLAKFANITRMNADNYSNLGSVIVDLGNNFATTEADIVSMATRLASTGEITGLSEAQIMAVSTALSSVGIEAEAGGSSVSKLLKEFEVMYQNGSEDLKDYADVAGVSLKEFREIYGEDSLKAVSMFISGLNDVERNGRNAVQILSDLDITEIRMSNAVLSLAASDGILTKAVDIANTAWEENTALAEEAGKRYQTTESQIQMAKNSINNAGIALGEVFTPYVAEAARGINEFARNTADWVRENPETIKQAMELITTVGSTALAFKGLKLAGTGIKTTVTGVKKLAGEGKLLSSIKWNAIGIAIAAVSAAIAESHRQYEKHLQDTANVIMYNNGAKTSLSDLTDAIVNYDDETYKAALAANQQAEEMKAVKDSISEAKRELDYYAETVDNGALSTDEAEALRKTFEDLGTYLEQDFSGAYKLVFDDFKNAVTTLGDEAGIASGEVASLLNSFKTDYEANIDDATQSVENYYEKVKSGTATDADREDFEKSQAMLYELAALDSENKREFEAAAAAIDGIDFGTNQEEAVAKINEITEFAKGYFEELNNAQESMQQKYDEFRARNEIQHNYGYISDEEYELNQSALATASVVSNTAYQQAFDDFQSQYGETLNLIRGQLNTNINKIVDDNKNQLDLGWDLLYSAKGALDTAGGFAFGGMDLDTSYEIAANAFRSEKENRVRADVENEMSGLLNAVNEMARNAEIEPIIIPVETKIAAATSGLIKNVSGSGAGYLSLQPEDIKVISHAYASGTNYSADTFLAGENGAEIVTNARGYQVYTAEETKDIFDTYMQIVSFLPMLQRVNTAASVKAPELSAGNEWAAPVNVTITIEQNISGGDPEGLKESNEELIYRIREVMEEISRDGRRRAFN